MKRTMSYIIDHFETNGTVKGDTIIEINGKFYQINEVFKRIVFDGDVYYVGKVNWIGKADAYGIKEGDIYKDSCFKIYRFSVKRDFNNLNGTVVYSKHDWDFELDDLDQLYASELVYDSPIEIVYEDEDEKDDFTTLFSSLHSADRIFYHVDKLNKKVNYIVLSSFGFGNGVHNYKVKEFESKNLYVAYFLSLYDSLCERVSIWGYLALKDRYKNELKK